MRTLILLLLLTNLFGVDQELIDARAKVREPVFIIFDLTVINKDKNTTMTTRIQETFLLKDWEKAYRPLTLLEFKTYGQLGYIRALPITLTIQTL